MPLVSFSDLKFAPTVRNEKPWIKITVPGRIEYQQDALLLRGRYFTTDHIETICKWLCQNGCSPELGIEVRLRDHAREEHIRAVQDRAETAAQLIIGSYR